MATENEYDELRRGLLQIKERLDMLEDYLGLAEVTPPKEKPTAPPPPLPRETPLEPVKERISQPCLADKPVPENSAGPELTNNLLSWKLTDKQQPTPPAGSKTLEQFIGLKGMLVFGVGFLLLACVFFFKYAFDRGWIVPTPPVRCLIGMIAGFIMLGFGEWTFRKKARLFAAVMFAGGVTLLYLTAWAASPNGLFYPKYEILGTTQAFASMCVITLIGILLSIRATMIAGAVIAIIGAFATPILLSSGENRQVELMSYMLAVEVGFLTLATLKRWPALIPLALAGTLSIFLSWFGAYGTKTFESQIWTLIFSWAFTLLFAAWAIVSQKTGRANCYFGISAVATTGCCFAAIWLIMHLNGDIPFHVFAANLLALNMVVIGLTQILRWHWIRLGVLGWTGLSMFLIYNGSDHIFRLDQDPAVKSAWQIAWLSWAWGFFILMTIDIFIRVKRKLSAIEQFVSELDAGLALAATALIATATYFCGLDLFPDWLGLVMLVMGSSAIEISKVFRRRQRHELMKTSYLVQGLALLTIAVPIQFENATIPLTWMVLGLISMVQARRLKDVVMLLFPAVTMILAMLYFCLSVLPDDPSMRELCFSVAGLNFTNAFVVTIGLAVGMLVTAAVLNIGPPVLKDEYERALSILICIAAAGFFMSMSARELPLVPATWAWLTAAGLMLVTGLIVRAKVEWSVGMATLLLATTALKWTLADTLHLFRGDIGEHTWIVLNPICLAGVCIISGFMLLPVIARLFNLPISKKFTTAMSLVAAGLVVWAGSWEVMRYVDTHKEFLVDPAKAMHMGLSIWWGVWATIMLVIGMTWRAPAARYFAIVLYGVTVGKVLLVDMQGIDAIYRILSFLVLGILLAVGSWAYYKFFKDVLVRTEEK